MTTAVGRAAWPALPIAAIQPLSLQDFPATPAAILFTQGCNLRCPYCHNPQLVEPHYPPQLRDGAEVGEFLQRRQGRLQGVVISGGEPTLHPQLGEFLTRCQSLGYRIKLDSNGMRPRVVGELVAAGLVDYLALDWKLPGPRYRELGGPGDAAARLHDCAAAARSRGVSVEWRTTVAWPLVQLEDLRHIARGIGVGEQWSLQRFAQHDAILCPQAELGPAPDDLLQQLITEHPQLRIVLR